MSEEAVQDMMHCNEMLFDEEEFAEALDDDGRVIDTLNHSIIKQLKGLE
jgi:hypothetical protein